MVQEFTELQRPAEAIPVVVVAGVATEEEVVRLPWIKRTQGSSLGGGYGNCKRLPSPPHQMRNPAVFLEAIILLFIAGLWAVYD